MEEKKLNALDLFVSNQESYEDAVKKSANEDKGFQRTKHFRIDSTGTYTVRILPIAPSLQADGTYTIERKGYEYPIKTQVLKLDNPKSTGKKDKQFFVNICQSSYAGLSTDLVDTYLKVAEAKYGDDEQLIKKIKGTGFDGGLKWNSQRAMYILDTRKRTDGIQMLTISYSQYKDLEDRKLAIWKKLMEKSPKCPCPISSPMNAYPVEITRKEDKGKTTYTFNIDTLAGCDELSENEMKSLLETPRLPEALYRYTRFHLEATIEFLKQYDEKMEMDVMSSKEIEEAIEKIKIELPADDKSHFSFDKKEKNNQETEENGTANDIDSLWDRWEKLNERNIGDKSEEGQELRDDIRDYIDSHQLSVHVTRNKTNKDLLAELEENVAIDRPNERQTPEDEDTGSASETARPTLETAVQSEPASNTPREEEPGDATNEQEPVSEHRRIELPERRRPR